MENIGTYGEYIVLAELLKRNIESYIALKKNQEDYDITTLVNNKIVRIQVKSTELNNKSTNNAIKGVDKNYDFLIILIYEQERNNFFVLSKQDVEAILENNGKMIYITKKENSKKAIRKKIEEHRNQWDKIKIY